MAKIKLSKKDKQAIKLNEQLKKEMLYPLMSNKGLLKLGQGVIERSDYRSDNEKLAYRYGIYVEPLFRNYIVVEEENTLHGRITDEVLISVTYDLMKMGGPDKVPYTYLINALKNYQDSFIYLSKSYDPNSWIINFNFTIDIFQNIPGVNALLIDDKVIPHLPSLLGMKESPYSYRGVHEGKSYPAGYDTDILCNGKDPIPFNIPSLITSVKALLTPSTLEMKDKFIKGGVSHDAELK
jgi:hypothetical protein